MAMDKDDPRRKPLTLAVLCVTLGLLLYFQFWYAPPVPTNAGREAAARLQQQLAPGMAEDEARELIAAVVEADPDLFSMPEDPPGLLVVRGTAEMELEWIVEVRFDDGKVVYAHLKQQYAPRAHREDEGA